MRSEIVISDRGSRESNRDDKEGFEQILRQGVNLVNLDYADLFLQVATRIREEDLDVLRGSRL